MNTLTTTLEPVTEEDITNVTGIETTEVKKILEAIADFTTADYRQIRRAEQEGIPDVRIDRLNLFMKKMPRYEGYIYRGLSLGKKSIQPFIERLEKSERYTLEAMASFTCSPSVAENYSGSCYSVVLRVQGNHSGVSIRNFSAMYTEEEVLVPKDTQYQVVNLPEKFERGKINYIDLREI
ncbi:MAG: ADP-ribosyltransferase domain-containing protein [Cyanobacteria bacterium J06592_8]